MYYQDQTCIAKTKQITAGLVCMRERECAWCSNVYQRGTVLNALKAPSRHLRPSPFPLSPIYLCKVPPIPAWAAESQGATLPGPQSHLSLCLSLCLSPPGATSNSNLKRLCRYRYTKSMRVCVYSRYTEGSCIALHTKATCTVQIPLLPGPDLCAYAHLNLSVRHTAEELVRAALRCAVQDHSTPVLHNVTRAVL